MIEDQKVKSKVSGYRDFFPYFKLIRPYWIPFVGALLCGLIYGVSSGFGLPFMTDQIFPKIFPDLVENSPTLSPLSLIHI